MGGIKSFVSAPFLAIREMWNEGPLFQWMVLIVVATFMFLFWIIGGAIKDHLVHDTVNSGVLVDKWFEPEHRQWTGKFYVHVPNRYHIVLEGQNIFGDKKRRDAIVVPDEFEKMKLREEYVLSP